MQDEEKAAEAMAQMRSAGPRYKYWLMKAEPDTRIVKEKDVAFPIEKLEEQKTACWDGVRNMLAKRYMKEEMKLGDKVLFYHSNTKMPGVAGLAEVVKEGYPDYTAWDPQAPYYDPSTNKEKPTWYMVDVGYVAKLDNFVPLSLFKYLASCKEVPKELPYLTHEHLSAIKEMPLINRGRLSVQPATQLAYEATVLMGERGGFEGLVEVKTSNKAGNKRRAPNIRTSGYESGPSRDGSETPTTASTSGGAFPPGYYEEGSLSKRSRRG